MFIHIYRPHNTPQMDTQFTGPFDTQEEAYDYHCSLPALGIYIEATEGFVGEGIKTFTKLVSPNDRVEAPLPTV